MKVKARNNRLGGKSELEVKSNPIPWCDSIIVYQFDPCHVQPLRYHTVTDFFVDYFPIDADSHTIAIPFLKRPLGLGESVAFFAERFPLWVKSRFHGCVDRRRWLNLWLKFVPIGGSSDLLSGHW